MEIPTITNKKLDETRLAAVLELMGELPNTGLKLLSNSVTEAKAVWTDAMVKMRETEDSLGALLHLNEGSKLYALDSVAVYKSLEIPKEKRATASLLFSLYYLAVHLFDDAVEDTEKLSGKFRNNNKEVLPHEVPALGANFALNLNIFMSNILKNAKPEESLRFIRMVNISLSKQFKFFMVEKNQTLDVNGVLEAKQHKVSGESTAFMIDCLKVAGVNLGSKETKLKQALYQMGSLTQFMDDLRDLDEDKKSGNLNLLATIEKEFGKENSLKYFAKLYKNEEEKMVKNLNSVGIINTEIYIAIPWHPFFMKHLV